MPPCADVVRDARAQAAETAARIEHRPTDRDSLAAEARRLAASGLRTRDIADALGLTVAVTAALLQRPLAPGTEVRS